MGVGIVKVYDEQAARVTNTGVPRTADCVLLAPTEATLNSVATTGVPVVDSSVAHRVCGGDRLLSRGFDCPLLFRVGHAARDYVSARGDV